VSSRRHSVQLFMISWATVFAIGGLLIPLAIALTKQLSLDWAVLVQGGFVCIMLVVLAARAFWFRKPPSIS